MGTIAHGRYTKWVKFLSKMVYKRVRGWVGHRGGAPSRGGGGGGGGVKGAGPVLRGVARIFAEVRTNFRILSPLPPTQTFKAPNLILVP